VRHDRGRAVAADRAHLLAQRIVGALGKRNGGIDIAASPRFDAGVDVQRVEFPAKTTNLPSIIGERTLR